MNRVGSGGAQSGAELAAHVDGDMVELGHELAGRIGQLAGDPLDGLIDRRLDLGETLAGITEALFDDLGDLLAADLGPLERQHAEADGDVRGVLGEIDDGLAVDGQRDLGGAAHGSSRVRGDRTDVRSLSCASSVRPSASKSKHSAMVERAGSRTGQ